MSWRLPANRIAMHGLGPLEKLGKFSPTPNLRCWAFCRQSDFRLFMFTLWYHFTFDGFQLKNVLWCYSFNKLLLQKEELEQKHVHLLQVVESEKTAKWQYTQQCEELSTEIKKLRNEVCFESITITYKVWLNATKFHISLKTCLYKSFDSKIHHTVFNKANLLMSFCLNCCHSVCRYSA